MSFNLVTKVYRLSRNIVGGIMIVVFFEMFLPVFSAFSDDKSCQKPLRKRLAIHHRVLQVSMKASNCCLNGKLFNPFY